MSTGSILKALREASLMTQSSLAEKVHVTRQAVSRWENDETIPGPDLLVKLSEIFNVSVDALLESPVIRYCECCGMPLEPSIMAKNEQGETDPRYCKWCLDNGRFVYTDPDELLEYLVTHVPCEQMSEEELRRIYSSSMAKLPYWKEKMAEKGEKTER